MTDSDDHPPVGFKPGIYLVNATGEMSPMATGGGGGDRNLLREAIDEHTDLTVVESDD